MVQRGNSDRNEVHLIQQPVDPPKSAPATPSPVQQAKAKPPAPCSHCGAWIFVRSCPYK
ncbi:unnamed protein product [Schistosoma curassoni]|uniref:Zinc finger, CCHC-type n=1 Tax=Schistosoma curassoni TaxID=6186 RepID=A0A183JKA0_9TREM|nr:unnamed protein product [Schistosoma curassoni]